MISTAPAIPASLTFLRPMAGLVNVTDYAVTPLDDDDLLFTLRAKDLNSLRLFVIDPRHVFPNYTPTIPAQHLASLEVDQEDQVRILVVVTPDPQEGHTVNLVAPVVVNTTTGVAAQVVLEDTQYDVRTPLRHP